MTRHLGETLMIPLDIDKVKILSWHPPFEEQEEETIDDEHNSIYWTCKRA